MEELLRRHGGRLHACAWRMLGDADTAVEIVHDVFMRLLAKAHELRDPGTVATWLYTTTLNHCRDHLRRAATRMFRDSAPLHETHPDLAPGPHDRIERSDRDRLVREALDALPEDLRATVTLRFASGLSYGEIAEVQGCAPGTVASRLHRALQRLGETLRAAGLTREAL